MKFVTLSAPIAPAIERRNGSLIHPLPFHPRRASDYAWLDRLRDQEPRVHISAPLIASALIHAFLLACLSHGFPRPSRYDRIIEVDLTGPYEIVPEALTHWAKPVRKGSPESTGKTLGKEIPKNEPSSRLPSASSTQPPSRPSATANETLDLDARRGSLTGSPEGAEVALIYLTSVPKLMNEHELAESLRRYYPEAERQAGHEASVVLDLHINAQGVVAHAVLIQPGGQAFDQAAIRVAKLFRFSPAQIGNKSVAVRIRQTIRFQLDG